LKSLSIEGISQYKLENESATRLRGQNKDLLCSLKKLHINEVTGETELQGRLYNEIIARKLSGKDLLF